MRETKPAPVDTAPNPQSDWYLEKGWRILNELLVEFPNQNRIWVENFDNIKQAVTQSTKKQNLIRRFNADVIGWQMKKDVDGVLYVERV